MQQNLAATWSFDLEFSVEPIMKQIFKVWQPLCPILTVDAFASDLSLSSHCDLVISLYTHLWPPTRITYKQKNYNKLYRIKIAQDGSSLQTELNGEIQRVRVLDPVPTGQVSVESQGLSFDGFDSDSASVSSQEFSERQKCFESWWQSRPQFIQTSHDIRHYL